jgi:hypothetical protein
MVRVERFAPVIREVSLAHRRVADRAAGAKTLVIILFAVGLTLLRIKGVAVERSLAASADEMLAVPVLTERDDPPVRDRLTW